MIEARSIERRKSSDNELSFASLRSEAIELLQQVSGKTWTDYNLHDPGITILEQLIYALTDLIYRSDFAVEDYLADSDGNVNLEKQYLHQPEQILSCRPTTVLDYRKLMLDAVPDVDNVWLTVKSDSKGYRGLYQLLVKLKEGLNKTQQSRAIERLRKTYHEARNLCEDLDPSDISVVENLKFDLCAKIEVGNAHDPVDLLARIYWTCAKRMASSVSITGNDQQSGEDRPLDQLFDGPLSSQGFLLDDEANKPRSEFLVSKLFACVNDIKDVDHIRELYLERNNEQFPVRIQTDRPGQAFDLSVPELAGKLKVELTTNGRVLPVVLDQVIKRYEELSFKEQVSRKPLQGLKYVVEPIRAASRPFTQYFSIQDQLPICYGVSQQGAPASADAETKGKVRQLKAYLLIFEQLMVNFLANIDAIKTLFSTTTEEGGSYAVHTLTEQQVADLRAVYPNNPVEVIGRIVARFDEFIERKGRLLDYLLAMYGERFTQNSLRHFNFYFPRDEIEKKIVANKINFLKSIIELGRDRAAAPAYDYFATKRGHCGLTLRASMLLGFERQDESPLTTVIADQGFHVCPHHEYQALKAGDQELQLISTEELYEFGYDNQYPVPLTPLDADISIHELLKNIADIWPLQDEWLSDKLLIIGVLEENFYIGDSGQGQDFRLLLKVEDDQFWHLGDYREKSTLIEAASCLRQIMLSFSRDSEGLYVVEHLLLRPHGSIVTSEGSIDEDFYSFKISVVLPDWTARCSTLGFQNLVEETIRLNAPAHVLPEFCWLNFADMITFERLQDDWQQLRSSQVESSTEIDRLAGELASFLVSHRQQWQEQE